MIDIKQKQIYWLASYPKSGNTWVRSFISALLELHGLAVEPESEFDQFEFDINKINISRSFTTRPFIEQQLGFDISDFSEGEIAKFRHQANLCFATKPQKPVYVKVHDANIDLLPASPLFDPRISLGALYIVRNPFDVAVSSANHSGISIDQSIELLCSDLSLSDHLAMRRNTCGPQVSQYLSDWSSHVRSWTEQERFPVALVRYEDLIKHGEREFGRVAEFLGLPTNAEQIAIACETTSFEKLKQQEKQSGFRESVVNADGFFRKGVIGDWQQQLSESQIQKLIDNHAVVMQKLGYLDENSKQTELVY